MFLHCFRAPHSLLQWKKENHKIIDSPDGYTDRDSNQIHSAFCANVGSTSSVGVVLFHVLQ